MKNNQVSVLLLISIVLLAGQLFFTLYAEKVNYRDLMLVVPDEYGVDSYYVEGIDQLPDESLAVTYEIKSWTAAKAAGSGRYPVTQIGTNSSYYQIFGLQILEGSFFTEEAGRAGNRYAVLNQTAALRLFGSCSIIGNTVDLSGETYLVIGIVKDERKKEAMIYVPSSTMSAPVLVLMVKTKESKETVRANLQQLGVYETNSKVINLNAVSNSFWQQFLVGVYLYIVLILVIAANQRVYVIRRDWEELQLRRQTMYLGELLEVSRNELLKLAGHVSVFLTGSGLILFLVRKILGVALGWKEILWQFKYLTDYFFQEKMQWLVRYFYCGPVLFLLFLFVLLMVIVLLCLEDQWM